MFIDLKRMNLYLLTFFWLSFGLVLLTIILPATLVTPGPNLGSLAPAAFYGAATAGWVIPVTSTCVTTPSTNYSGVRRLSNDNFAPGGRSPLSTLSNLAWAFGQLVMEDMVVLTPNNAAASPIVIALSDLGVNVTMDVVPVVTRSELVTPPIPGAVPRYPTMFRHCLIVLGCMETLRNRQRWCAKESMGDCACRAAVTYPSMV